jgi:hypothetical protein
MGPKRTPNKACCEPPQPSLSAIRRSPRELNKPANRASCRVRQGAWPSSAWPRDFLSARSEVRSLGRRCWSGLVRPRRTTFASSVPCCRREDDSVHQAADRFGSFGASLGSSRAQGCRDLLTVELRQIQIWMQRRRRLVGCRVPFNSSSLAAFTFISARTSNARRGSSLTLEDREAKAVKGSSHATIIVAGDGNAGEGLDD